MPARSDTVASVRLAAWRRRRIAPPSWRRTSARESDSFGSSTSTRPAPRGCSTRHHFSPSTMHATIVPCARSSPTSSSPEPPRARGELVAALVARGDRVVAMDRVPLERDDVVAYTLDLADEGAVAERSPMRRNAGSRSATSSPSPAPRYPRRNRRRYRRAPARRYSARRSNSISSRPGSRCAPRSRICGAPAATDSITLTASTDALASYGCRPTPPPGGPDRPRQLARRTARRRRDRINAVAPGDVPTERNVREWGHYRAGTTACGRARRSAGSALPRTSPRVPGADRHAARHRARRSSSTAARRSAAPPAERPLRRRARRAPRRTCGCSARRSGRARGSPRRARPRRDRAGGGRSAPRCPRSAAPRRAAGRLPPDRARRARTRCARPTAGSQPASCAIAVMPAFVVANPSGVLP